MASGHLSDKPGINRGTSLACTRAFVQISERIFWTFHKFRLITIVLSPSQTSQSRRIDHANQEVCRFCDDTALRSTCSEHCSQGCRSALWHLEDEPCKVKVQSRTNTEEYHGKDRL